MSPATRLGVALRRLGTLTAIRQVRTEQAIRLDAHGGDIAKLNLRLTERANRAYSDMLRTEKDILG